VGIVSIDRTSTIHPEMTMSLEDAVLEVFVLLTGQTLRYDQQYDRFRAITHTLNRALRGNAMEQEWSYYHEQLDLGTTSVGDVSFEISAQFRFRVVGDDAVRFVTDDGVPLAWAYFLPRDALHKYRNREGLWASYTRKLLSLSRPLVDGEEGLHVHLPVMREPKMFELPDDPTVAVDPDVLTQQIDFDIPDIITARAAWLYSQTDPIMQPRVQTLEDQYKDLMYQAIERDTQQTESTYMNEILIPVQNDIYGESRARPWPVANRRRALDI
jgi:hypothetical protein